MSYITQEKSPLIKGNNHSQFNSIGNDVEANDDEEEEFEYSIEVLQRDSKPRYSLLVYDCLFMILEYIQYYALLQSLAMRWTWPGTWISNLYFLFLFNIDLWDFVKVTSGAFIPARDYYTPSADVPINFKAWSLTCLVFLCLFVVLYFGIKKYLQHRELTKAIAAGNLPQRIMITIVHIFALPVGVNFGKFFWCNPNTNTLDVANDVQCWNTEHCIYIVIVVILFGLYYLLYAYWLTKTVHAQIVSHNNKQHEAHLRLKDCEEMFKLDGTWNHRLFFLFASYRRFWAYGRVVSHLTKFVVVAMYSGLFMYRLPQISTITLIFFIFTTLTLVPRQYRVGSFNLLSCLCWFCLSANAVVGVLLNMEGFNSVFTTENYVNGELLLINLGWLILTLVLILYFVLRANGILCGRRDFWPSMISKHSKKLPENMQRYMYAAVQARFVLQQATEVPPLLSPVHELAHQIHIINALACEAEYLKDPLQSSLRSVLDDLITLHSRLVGQSLFSENLKPGSKSNITELLKVIPDLTKRLNQREFDFILISPLRRRLLFKMYVISCFLPNSRRKDAVPISKVQHDFWRKTPQAFGIDDPDNEKVKKVIEEHNFSDEGFEDAETFNEYDEQKM